MAELLNVQGLETQFRTREGMVHAVNGVSFHLKEGETLGIVGESGCGKSVSVMSMLRLIPTPPGKVVAGSAMYQGKDLLKMSDEEIRHIRGSQISMVFQDPMTSFNPVLTIGRQVSEPLEIHSGVSKQQAYDRAAEMLGMVGIPKAKERLNDYPHQFSGGMRQRVMIAMALSCNPKLLIADEPTTALDVTIQAQILKVMGDLKKEFGMAIMLITHDLGVVAEMAERVAVMYAGRVVEVRSSHDLFNDPQHPYTEGLLNSIPGMDRTVARLNVIEGNVPNLLDLPSGCAFRDRCPHALPRCAQDTPVLESVRTGLQVACFNYHDLREASKIEILSPEAQVVTPGRESSAPLVEVRNLVKNFEVDKGFLGRGKKFVHAVDNVSFTINEGETFGLVGESGCGKTTTGRIIVGLENATSGDVHIMGKAMTSRDQKSIQELRKTVQIIFQDPYSSLNPRMKVETIISEGLRIHYRMSQKEKEERVLKVMRSVGLEDYHLDRFPHEFSGGQRQRIGIARALVLNPKFIVCDEPVSALDVSIQAQILNLLRDLQQSLNLTYLFIAHNLSVVKHISDRIGVLYLGNLVEVTAKDEMYAKPLHPYTQALLSAAPIARPGLKKDRILLEGDIPSPIHPPSGCRFRTRCPIATPDCAETKPELREVAPGHHVACLRV